MARNVAMTWAPPASLTSRYVNIGNRCSVNTATGDNRPYNVRSVHLVWVTIPGVVPLWIGEANWSCGQNVSFTDTGTGADLNATLALEYPLGGTRTQGLWNGASSAAIASGATASALVSFTAPTVGIYQIAIRRHLQSPSGVIPLKRMANGGKRSIGYGDIVEQSATDKTLTGTMVDDGFVAADWMSYPLWIVSLSTGASLWLEGDSIQAGEGQTDDNRHRGIIATPYGDTMPYINAGVASQGYRVAALSAKRLEALQYTTHQVSEAGINYRANGAAAMYAASQAQKADGGSREYWQCTLLPKSTSTGTFSDGTGADQTTDGFSAAVTSYNALVEADPHCIDNEATLGLAGDLRKWNATPPAKTTDGTHPNDAGYLAATAPGLSPTVSDYTFLPTSPPS